MARSQHTFRPIAYGTWEVGRPVRIGDGSTTQGLDDLAKNVNTVWATRCPDLVTQCCPSSDSLRYTVCDAGTYTDMWYWVIPVGGYGSRDQLVGQVQYLTSDGSTVSTIKAETLIEGDSDTTNLPASTSVDWVDLNTVTLDTSGDVEILKVSAVRSSGTGETRIRGIRFFVEPHSGDLPSGIENNGFESLDVIQFAFDEPLTVGRIKKVSDNLQTLHKDYRVPYVAHSIAWTTSKSDAYRTSEEDEYTRIAGPFLVYRRTGEDITTLQYYIFPYCPTGTTGSITVEAFRSDGALLDTNTHSIAAGDDPEVLGDWITGELPLYANDQHPTTIVISARRDSGSDPVGVRSWSFFAKDRS